MHVPPPSSSDQPLPPRRGRVRSGSLTARERAIAALTEAAGRRSRALDDADTALEDMLAPLRELYESESMSVAELARLAGMTRTQIYPYLRAAGIDTSRR